MGPFILLKLGIGPWPMVLALHLRQLETASRIIGAESLGHRKVEQVAKRLKKIAGLTRLHLISHALDEFLRQQGYAFIAVLCAEFFQKAAAHDLRARRQLAERQTLVVADDHRVDGARLSAIGANWLRLGHRQRPLIRRHEFLGARKTGKPHLLKSPSPEIIIYSAAAAIFVDVVKPYGWSCIRGCGEPVG